MSQQAYYVPESSKLPFAMAITMLVFIIGAANTVIDMGKDSNSYLYLAKIYNIEEDQNKEEKNLETTFLIEPNNEEAILMSMKIALKKSNYSKVKDLSNTFTKVCKKLCDENKGILETLANIEPKNNES